MHDSLISRTGRFFVCRHRDGCGGSLTGRVYRILRFAWRLLVLRPATLAGFVLVVAFLYQKIHGTAVPYWQSVLQAQAASYRDAPAGSVMQMNGCFTDKAASQVPVILPLPENSEVPRFCEPQRVAVSIDRVAQNDIAVFTAIYAMLVFFSFIWMVFSGQVLPVATENRGYTVNVRSARSRVVRKGDCIVVVTPEGELHTVPVDKEGRRIATGSDIPGTEEGR